MRTLYAEIVEGFNALSKMRDGDQAPRMHQAEPKSVPIVKVAKRRALLQRQPRQRLPSVD